MTGNNGSAAFAEHDRRRLVPLDGRHLESVQAKPVDGRVDFRPPAVARAKQALLDDLRILVLQGVEPRPDGLERSPSAESLAVAEKLLYWLPDDIELPTACLPDDGEITFSWRTSDDEREGWRAMLAISPDLEVECFVRRSSENPAVHFIEENGADIIDLPAEIEEALRARWQRPDALQ